MPAISIPTAVAVGGSIFSSVLGAAGASKSASAIRYASDKASNTALELNTRSRADLQPFRDLGVKSSGMISDLFSGKSKIDDLYKGSSLYQYQSELGTRALDRQLSARGMSGSGAGLESLALFDKSLVAEEGNRYFDKLFNTTTLGANAAAQQASNTTATGNTVAGVQAQAGVGIGQAYQNQYNAYAGGVQGVAGAVRGGYSDALTMQYLDRFFPSQGNPAGRIGASPGYVPGTNAQDYSHTDFSTF